MFSKEMANEKESYAMRNDQAWTKPKTKQRKTKETDDHLGVNTGE